MHPALGRFSGGPGDFETLALVDGFLQGRGRFRHGSLSGSVTFSLRFDPPQPAFYTTGLEPLIFGRPEVSINEPTPRYDRAGKTFDITGLVSEGGMGNGSGLYDFVVTLNGQPLVLDTPLERIRFPWPSMPVRWSVTGVNLEDGPNVIVATAENLMRVPIEIARPVIVGGPATAGLDGTYEALLEPEPAADGDPGTLGLIQVLVTQRGTFSGSVSVEGVRLPVSGILAPDGSARFRPGWTPELELTAGRGLSRRSLGFLSLGVAKTPADEPGGFPVGQLAPVEGADPQRVIFKYSYPLAEADHPTGLSGELRGAGGAVLASFAGMQAPFGRTNPVPQELLNLPVSGAPTRGYYNLAFIPRETDGSRSPVGYGIAGLTLSRAGLAVVRGLLADGTRFTGSTRLRADRSLPCFRRIYGNQATFGGELAFDPGAADNDLTGEDWLWLRPALSRARAYPDGWPQGARLDVIGAKYAASTGLDFGQGPVDGSMGNVRLQFRDGRLTGPKILAANLDPLTGNVSRVPAGATAYTLGLSPVTGHFGGSFVHEDATRPHFRGLLLNKGANRGGFGFFLSAGPGGQSGAVILDPERR